VVGNSFINKQYNILSGSHTNWTNLTKCGRLCKSISKHIIIVPNTNVDAILKRMIGNGLTIMNNENSQLLISKKATESSENI